MWGNSQRVESQVKHRDRSPASLSQDLLGLDFIDHFAKKSDLLVRLFSGYHHLAGFTWADHANDVMINGILPTVYGGRDYALFWSFLCLTFVLTGEAKVVS